MSAHAADQKGSQIGTRRQPGEPDRRLGSIVVPLSAVDGQQDGAQVELRVMGTIQKIGKGSATVTLDDIQATQSMNAASAMESSLRGKGA